MMGKESISRYNAEIMNAKELTEPSIEMASKCPEVKK
jgi:hypothetical protein